MLTTDSEWTQVLMNILNSTEVGASLATETQKARQGEVVESTQGVSLFYGPCCLKQPPLGSPRKSKFSVN